MSSISSLSSAYAAILATNALKKVPVETKASATQAAVPSSSQPDPMSPSATADTKPVVTKALFQDIYNGHVLAAVDTNGDQKVSREEFSAQILAAGGSQSHADALYKSMDKDGDGTVSGQEFIDNIKSPFAKEGYAQKILDLMQQIRGGQSTAPLQGNILNADGQMSDANSDQMLRNLATTFSGNV
ncbi:EF-hand domain-containing protein [Undibacterium sp. TJN25]|uniref:EF-hand domain-containing protein n=1 Tax=Undibacterium sp. TJN25 TaxID=3413056 RepID=UPI003BF397E9